MTDSAKGYAPILAAGGIVLRGEARPRIAVVRMRREKAWVLPKGKLLPRERAHIAAKREVLEETGYDTTVHEFLGSMSYMAEGRLKIVQFWLMRVVGRPTHELMGDVKAVKFLPLKKAIETLTRPHEKVFLTHVGPIALKHAKKFGGKSRRVTRNGGKRSRTLPPSPVEHVIALDYGKTSPSTVKALGNWVGRARHLARLAG
ncbi:MAG: NUDIX domain-containing protein [Xanthobacteraceae bacterium]